MPEPVEAPIASVTEVWRYVVKGLRGEQLDNAELHTHGIDFDRALAIAHDRVPLAPFGQWTTYDAFHALDARPDLGSYGAALDRDGRRISVTFTGPEGREASVALTDNADIDQANFTQGDVAAWFGTPTSTARLIYSGSHLWDFADAPISLISETTLRDIGRTIDRHIDKRRFRANVYIDGLEPWSEFDLAGRRFAIGKAEIEVMRPIERCRATSVDPDNGGTDINMPGVLSTFYGHLYCGMYARVTRPGLVRAGDSLTEISDQITPGRFIGVPAKYLAAAPRFATVTDIHKVTPRVASIKLEDPIEHLPTARPGQHIRVHGRTGGQPWWRSYTISGTYAGRTRISVQLRDSGVGSGTLHQLAATQRLLVTGPFGGATTEPSSTEHLLVLTAGIGITPALAIAQAMAEGDSKRAIDFVHIGRDLSEVPHWTEVTKAVDQLGNAREHLFLTRAQPSRNGHHSGRPRPEFIAALLTDTERTEVHVCGPIAFLQDMRNTLANVGVPEANVHFDPFYSPRQEMPELRDPPKPGPFEVAFNATGRKLTWEPSTGTLLELAEANGVTLPAGCRAGVCGTCTLKVVGEVAYVLEPMTQPRDGEVLTCCAVPVSDLSLS
jgi:uncharacterized protein